MEILYTLGVTLVLCCLAYFMGMLHGIHKSESHHEEQEYQRLAEEVDAREAEYQRVFGDDSVTPIRERGDASGR